MSKSPRKIQTGRESHPLPSSLYPEHLPAMLKRKKKKQRHTKFSISAKNGQKRAKSKRVNPVTQSRQRDSGERQKNKPSARLRRGKQDNGDAVATPQFCTQLRKQRQREERRETNRVTRRRPLPLSGHPARDLRLQVPDP
jgi:hypothetical protein